MDPTLQFLRRLDLRAAPQHLQGLAPNSCTATVGCLMHLLCNTNYGLSDLDQGDSRPGGAPEPVRFRSAHAKDFANMDKTSLLVFNMPAHKFAVLKKAEQKRAYLLQSQQLADKLEERPVFTFTEYINDGVPPTKKTPSYPPKTMNATELEVFLAGVFAITQLPSGEGAVPKQLQAHINLRFDFQKADECWLAEIPM